MSESQRYQANPEVSCGDEEDGAVLFNPDTDDTAIVNLSGRALWAFLETPRTLDEMASYLTKTYANVTSEQAEEHANQFVHDLTPDFVLEVQNGG